MGMKINGTWVMATLGVVMLIAELLTISVTIFNSYLGWGYTLTFFILAMISIECLLFIRYDPLVCKWYENRTYISKKPKKTVNPLNSIKGLFKRKEKTLILPEGWGEPNPPEVKLNVSPLAVNPIFHYSNPGKKRRFGIRIPYRVKRMIAFILFLICIGLIYNTVILRQIDLMALIYFIPKTAMILYYLKRTQPKISTMTHILDDLEKT